MKDLSIGILAPALASPSHLWMRRQIDLLKDYVGVIVTDDGHGNAVPPEHRLKEISSPRWPLSRVDRLRRWNTKRQLRQVFNQKEISTVLIHYLTRLVEFESIWPELGKPLFVHCHGYDVTWNLKDPHSNERIHSESYIKSILRLAEKVQFIANSHWTERQLLQIGIPDTRIHVKYFGISCPPTALERPTRKELTVLYLGRMIDCKGPIEVIRSFEEAVKGGFNGRLIMAGDGELKTACEEITARSSLKRRIELRGAVTAEEGWDLMESADIFTTHNKIGSNNQQEAFGVTNLEAMAASLPIIGTISGAVPEVVNDGETGILVAPGDIDAHARALIRLGEGENIRSQMGNAGWNRARERFSQEYELNRFLEIFSQF